MPKIIDLTGQPFGRLTVISFAGTANNGEATWLCKCSCGNTSTHKSYYLRKGTTKSCGCLRDESRITHGHTIGKRDTATYKTWENMIQRCTNQKHHHWHKYGGAGITVCQEWRDYSTFLADMGNRPNGHTLDRINNNIGYSRSNCRWATPSQQQRNRKTSRMITWNGKTQLMIEWAEELNIPYSTIESRMRAGMPLDKVFTQQRLIGRPAFLE